MSPPFSGCTQSGHACRRGHLLEEPLFEHGHGSDDAGLAACRQCVQLDVARDKSSDELGVRRRASAATPDRLADVVDLGDVPLVSHAAGRSASTSQAAWYLFAVFVCDNLACGRARVGTEHNPIFK